MSKKDDRASSGGKTGRPLKIDGPRVPYEEIDRLLVHGEEVVTETGAKTVDYPSYRDLARRYGCSHSLIATYARKHNCLKRRKEAQARIEVKTDQKLIELRAHAIAVTKDDALQIIDSYLLGFGEAINEGRVRFDNPGDFNTMLRLKEFIMGNADSRQEVHAALSLEDIQARHQRMLKVRQKSSSEERGEIPSESGTNPPALPTKAAAVEVPGHFSGHPVDTLYEEAPQAPPCRAEPGATSEETSDGETGPQGADVAPAARFDGEPGGEE